ncbi:MAG: sigma factor-like helix-turn-helix DNA-binding protein, partial [Puia sp.]
IAEAMAHQQMLIRLQIARIPGKSGQVFHMLFIRKLGEAEIARQLGISEKTVRNLMSGAFRFLKIHSGNSLRRYAYPIIILLLIYFYENF